MVHISLIVLRRRPPVRHVHFKAPIVLPYLGAVACLYLAGPWARTEEQRQQYVIAVYLLGIGIVLWLITYFWNRTVRHKEARLAPEELAERPDNPSS
jgi:basic amino acid/polyamine antiporter, APA family